VQDGLVPKELIKDEFFEEDAEPTAETPAQAEASK